MAGNKSLNAAAKAKQDEFYTQLTDIEKELRHYRQHFMGKTVLCNCDDPFESNFFKYFVLNFNRLGLKKLIATCYATSPIMGSKFRYSIEKNGQMSFCFGDKAAPDDNSVKRPYKAVVTTVYDKTGDGGVDMLDVAELFRSGENELSELAGDGDFRSEECLKLVDEADIVCTNPPFSLFREYVAMLMEHGKKFVIIGPQNATKYKEIFSLIQSNRLWLGYGFEKGDAYFRIPEKDIPSYATGVYDSDTGMVHFRNCVWLTNLDIKKRHEDLILVRRYSPNNYMKFENYNAIIVDKIADIPCDYSGIMGVPITFLNIYNPDQFEIYGRTGNIEWATTECDFYTPPSSEKQAIYKKQNKTWRIQNGYYVTDDGIAHTVYDRFFVRNKHPEQ